MPSTSILELYRLKEVEIRSKREWDRPWSMSPKLWWHLVVPMFFFFIGIFRKKQKVDFYEHYFTTINNTVWCPDAHFNRIRSQDHVYRAILRHELVHVRDMLRDGRIKYWFRYLFCKKWRAYYERRGYTQNLIVQFERTGRITSADIADVVNKFTGSMYFQMDLDASPKIHEIARQIVNGQIHGFYPDVN